MWQEGAPLSPPSPSCPKSWTIGRAAMWQAPSFPPPPPLIYLGLRPNRPFFSLFVFPSALRPFLSRWMEFRGGILQLNWVGRSNEEKEGEEEEEALPLTHISRPQQARERESRPSRVMAGRLGRKGFFRQISQKYALKSLRLSCKNTDGEILWFAKTCLANPSPPSVSSDLSSPFVPPLTK